MKKTMVCKRGHRYEWNDRSLPPARPFEGFYEGLTIGMKDDKPPSVTILGASAGPICGKCIAEHLRETYGLVEEDMSS